MSALSLTGYTADLARLAVGDSVARLGRVPLADRHTLDRFRSSITAANARASGSFSVQSLDAVSDDFSHAIRVVVTTRTSA